MPAISIPLLLALGLVIIAAGGLAFRAARGRPEPEAHARRTFAWFTTLLGFALVMALAAGHFTGRFGAERLWFRAPTFYVAAAILLAGTLLWFRRPARPAVRFGWPALSLAVLAGGGLLLRSHGNSAPLAMSMPTLSQAAPALTYFDDAGRLRALSEFKGKVVLLNFWATWCTPCRREMPLLSRLQTDYRDAGLVVLYVSLEEPPVLAEFLREHRFEGVQGRLDNAAPFYGAGKFYPLSYLISREGRVEKRWSGRPSESWVDAAVRAELDPAG